MNYTKTVVWSLLFLFVTFDAKAVSLGALTPSSKFGQALQATVDVNIDGLPPEEYSVGLASAGVHQSTGVDYTLYHQGVVATIVESASGYDVLLQHQEHLKEPVFEFVLELKWRGGKVQRLYTLLPEFLSAVATHNTAPVARNVDESSDVAPRPETTNASVIRQSNAGASTSTATPSSASVNTIEILPGKYTVQAGDSLWLIASRMPSNLGNIAQRVDRVMSANLALIKNNRPVGIHPGDQLIIPDASYPTVPMEAFNTVVNSATPLQKQPFYRDQDAKEALLARVRGRQLIRLAALQGRYIDSSTDTAAGNTRSDDTPDYIQQRVDELDRRETALENRLAVLDAQVDQVLAQQRDTTRSDPVLNTVDNTSQASGFSWLAVRVFVILLFVSLGIYWFIRERRKEAQVMEDESYQVDAELDQAVGQYREVERPVEDETTHSVEAAIHEDDDDIDERFNISQSVVVRDPDWDDVDVDMTDDTAHPMTALEADEPEPPEVTQQPSEPSTVSQDESESIEFQFDGAEAEKTKAEQKVVQQDDDDDGIEFSLSGFEQSDDALAQDSPAPDVEVDGDVEWPQWDEVTAVDVIDDEKAENTIVFGMAGANDQTDTDSSDSSGAVAKQIPDEVISASDVQFDQTVQIEAPHQVQGVVVAGDEDDHATTDTQIEPLKRMLLAGPKGQPKVKTVANASTSPFETLLFNYGEGVANRALFYIEINDLDDIENRIGPLEAEQVAQHLGVKIRNYVGIAGATDELMRLRDSTYLYVGEYQFESELTEFGEAIAQMVSTTNFSSGSGENKVSVELSVSIGIVPISPHFEGVNEYLICAKKTVDEARGLAQDGIEVPQVALFSTPIDMLDQDEQLIERVAQYLRDEQFDIVFQPLINLTGNCEFLFSAKAELSDGVDMSKLPDHFLASAFASSASISLDKYAIRRSLEQVIQLHSQRQEAVVLVRVSDNSVHDSEFITWLKKLVVGHEHYARQLVLCLDEHFIGRQRVACWSFCNALKNSRYQIGINSFGASNHSLDYAVELGASIVRFDNDKVNLAIKTSEGIEHLSRLATVCKERGIETITYTFNSTAIPSIWQFNIDAIRSNYILVPDRSNSFEISGV